MNQRSFRRAAATRESETRLMHDCLAISRFFMERSSEYGGLINATDDPLCDNRTLIRHVMFRCNCTLDSIASV